MIRFSSKHIVRSVTAALVALAGSTTRSIAADPVVFDLPAGLACPGFDLRVSSLANPNRVSKTFTDKNGNTVRLLTAGKGSALTLTNLNTGASLSLRANGAVEHGVPSAGGLTTWTITGHNVLILFPTDVPAGPSTTLHVGQVVFTATATFDFNVLKVTGKSVDMCAALSA